MSLASDRQPADSGQTTEDSSQQPAVSGQEPQGRDRETERSDPQLDIPNSQLPGPPHSGGNARAGATRNSQLAISCPFCGRADVELFSLFGSQLLTSEYYCRNCRTVFENVKR